MKNERTLTLVALLCGAGAPLACSGGGAVNIGNTEPRGYPPGISEGGGGFGSVIASGLFEGFLYPLHAAQVQTDRIQLGIVPDDLWATWCALQTPVPWATGDDGGATSYGCVANLGGSISGGACAQLEPDGTSVPIDCVKLSLCQFGMVCTCTATACASVSAPATTPIDQYSVEIDGALDSTGTTLTGTLNLDGTRITVHLTKQ